MYNDYREISDIKGKTFVKVENSGEGQIRFVCEDGSYYSLEHVQDCCESVWLDDITGDLSNLEDTEILVAEERFQEPSYGEDEYTPESSTWTFYTFRTVKGTVTLRWIGESNGYYSESVSVFYNKVQ